MPGVHVELVAPDGDGDGVGVVVGDGVGEEKPVVTENVGFGLVDVDAAVVEGVRLGVGVGTLPSEEIICLVAICIIGLPAR
jgi:hypothetical protein